MCVQAQFHDALTVGFHRAVRTAIVRAENEDEEGFNCETDNISWPVPNLYRVRSNAKQIHACLLSPVMGLENRIRIWANLWFVFDYYSWILRLFVFDGKTYEEQNLCGFYFAMLEERSDDRS